MVINFIQISNGLQKKFVITFTVCSLLKLLCRNNNLCIHLSKVFPHCSPNPQFCCTFLHCLVTLKAPARRPYEGHQVIQVKDVHCTFVHCTTTATRNTIYEINSCWSLNQHCFEIYYLNLFFAFILKRKTGYSYFHQI